MNSMKWPVGFAVIWFLITGCAPSVSSYEAHNAPQSNPMMQSAQATLAAGQSQAQQLALQSTQIALQIAQAQATEAYFIRQTQQAGEKYAQQTAQAYSITMTAQAISAQSTQQAFEQQITQTALAEHALAVQATATAQAVLTATTWPQTATPQKATQMAIVAETVRTERRMYWEQFVAPFWTFFSVGILLLFVWLIIKAYQRLLPVLELRLRTIISPDGEMVTFLPRSTEITTLLPGRAAGPAVHSTRETSHLGGLPPELQLQARALAALEGKRNSPNTPASRSQSGASTIPIDSQMPDSVYQIVSRQNKPPNVDPDTVTILEGDWREI
ncbi:hypothetical protein D6833_08025 [Candidatus Parcubacteria bacterium]|nr:MAG: hypothetical protein D6833_08025 [Candidatus Parcubacteria bacterium]